VCASSARRRIQRGEREKAIGKSDVICRRTHHEWRKVWLRLFMNVESGAGRFLATNPYDGDAHAAPAKSAQAVRAGTTENAASHPCFQLNGAAAAGEWGLGANNSFFYLPGQLATSTWCSPAICSSSSGDY
jgi:hypothetical protein